MSALNVIGNNISNVNTMGYKASRYTFSEALYTTSRSGSDGTATMGGRNPAQIGYGCSIGTIDIDMSSKNYSPTAQALDCTIDGDGFFLVGNKTTLGVNNQTQLKSLMLTRLGNFDVKDGYLVDGEGNVVYGFLRVQSDDDNADEYGTVMSTVLTPIRVPYATQTLVDGGAIDDEGQNAASVRTTLWWPTVEGEGLNTTVQDATAEDMGLESADDRERVSTNTFAIDETGRITITISSGESYILGYVAIGKVDSPNGVTHVDGHYYQALGGAGDIHLTTVDGAVTYVPDEDAEWGLTIESAGNTAIITSGLESSGTDLAQEITNMITIQRGYQANTRIVTVTDSMLEELVNMKR